MQQEKKIDKLDIIKILNVYALKDIVEKMKRKPSKKEKSFTNHVSDIGYPSVIYTKLVQLNNKKTTQF